MQTQDVAIRPNVRVILKSDAEQLDEVVVTAMGIKRDRKALGYAAQDLNSEQLNKAGTTSLASAIQGKLTGVDIRQSSGAPGASSQIVIRGARSFDGNNQPLYVIDGMPVNTTADFDTGKSVTGANYADRSIDINPEDIESEYTERSGSIRIVWYPCIQRCDCHYDQTRFQKQYEQTKRNDFNEPECTTGFTQIRTSKYIFAGQQHCSRI